MEEASGTDDSIRCHAIKLTCDAAELLKDCLSLPHSRGGAWLLEGLALQPSSLAWEGPSGAAGSGPASHAIPAWDLSRPALVDLRDCTRRRSPSALAAAVQRPLATCNAHGQTIRVQSLVSRLADLTAIVAQPAFEPRSGLGFHSQICENKRRFAQEIEPAREAPRSQSEPPNQSNQPTSEFRTKNAQKTDFLPRIYLTKPEIQGGYEPPFTDCPILPHFYRNFTPKPAPPCSKPKITAEMN